MANIVINSQVSEKGFTVQTNAFKSAVGSANLTFSKSDIGRIYTSSNDQFVVMELKGISDLMFSPVGFSDAEAIVPKIMKLDSISGVTDLDTILKIWTELSKLKM